MSKKWMAVVIGVAILAVALGATFFLIPRNTNSPATPSATTQSNATSSTTSSTESSATSSTGVTGSSTTSPSSTTGTAPSSTTGGTSQTNPAGLVPLKPFATLPEPDTTKAMTAPAAPGEKLPRVSPGPDDVYSASKSGAVPDGSSYTITLRPYGIGPSDVWGSRILVRIDAATAIGGAPAYNVLTGHNWLVIANTSDNGGISTGGTYTAKLTFRSDGTKLLPIIGKVKTK